MENTNFKAIQSDNRLTKSEIRETEDLIKDQEKVKILTQTNKEFRNFINTDYRYANEGYLSKNGKTVKTLQKKLGFKGNEADGIFGKKTFLALIKYQKENGLRVDGLAGDKTQTKLFGAITAKRKKSINPDSSETGKIYVVKNKPQKTQIQPRVKTVFPSYGNESNGIIAENKGDELVSFIEKLGYPPLKKGGYCGANVGTILNRFGVDGLPRSGRDGYKWESFLEKNLNFRSEDISSPLEAKEGGILVYERGYGNGDRSRYGHVEIALGKGKYYYGSKKNSSMMKFRCK